VAPAPLKTTLTSLGVRFWMLRTRAAWRASLSPGGAPASCLISSWPERSIVVGWFAALPQPPQRTPAATANIESTDPGEFFNCKLPL
jgi:hypothetical protein